jgi:hypothetical protein
MPRNDRGIFRLLIRPATNLTNDHESRTRHELVLGLEGRQKDSCLLDGYVGRLHAARYSVAPSGAGATRFREGTASGTLTHPPQGHSKPAVGTLSMEPPGTSGTLTARRRDTHCGLGKAAL